MGLVICLFISNDGLSYVTIGELGVNDGNMKRVLKFSILWFHKVIKIQTACSSYVFIFISLTHACYFGNTQNQNKQY